MGKNVAVFVDVANVFYAAKAAGVDIDYVTLLKSVTAGRDFVRAYAYTGLDPDNENQRNFHQFLARHQYKVVSKDIRKYGDGKVKANLDIELVVDLMKTARNLDVAVIVSGDGDFASAIRAVQEMGVRVEVVSFRGNTSSDLIEVADLFTDIIHIAKVDRGSTVSGRRVAGDDEDLSMTEVPDKLSEGSGRGRGRGRGRDRSDREGGYASGSRGGRSSSGRDRGRDSARDSGREPGREAVVAPIGISTVGLVALPGEKLSRAAAAPVEDAPELEEGLEIAAGEVVPGEDLQGEGEGEGDGRRRRRRRGGRGRGRGRRDDQSVEGGEPVEAGGVDAVADVEGQEIEGVADAQVEEADDVEQGEAVAATAPPERPARGGRSRTPSGDLPTPFDDLEALSAPPRSPRSTPFGSVWDRQPGTPVALPAAKLAPLPDDEEDFEEPAIPEYLLTEQRRGQGGRGGGGGRSGRGGGGRSAYTSAIERERYGGGRGGGTNRFAEPAPGRSGGQGGGGSQGSQGSRGGRGGQQSPRGPRPERQDRIDRAPRTGGAEWSEVPPELEEMLRAQLQRARPVEAPAQTAPAAGTAAPKRRTTRKPAAAAEAPAPVAEAPAEPVAKPAPKRRTTRKPAAAAEAPATAVEAPAQTAPAAGTAAPKRRTTRKPAAAAEAPAPVAEAPAEPVAKPAPKRRTTRKPAAAAEAPATAVEAPAQTAPAAGTAAPKRRTTRKPAAQPAED